MRYYTAVIISMLLWGSIGIFTRYVNQPSQVIVFFRVLSASLVLFPFAIKTEKTVPGRKDYIILLMSGIFLSLNWLFFFISVKTTTIAKATLSYYAAPVFVVLLSPFILKEKLEKRTIISIIMAFLGIFLVILHPLSEFLSGDNTGILFGILAAFFYSLVTISAKRLSSMSAIKLTFFQTLISTIVFLPFVIGSMNIDINSMLIMCIMGILHTSVALTLYFYGIKGIKAQHAGVLSYIDPLSAILFGFVIFGEIPSLTTALGGLLILSAGFIIMKRNV